MKHPCRIFILVSLITLMIFIGFYKIVKSEYITAPSYIYNSSAPSYICNSSVTFSSGVNFSINKIVTFESKDGRRAIIDFGGDKITYKGNLPVDESAKLFFEAFRNLCGCPEKNKTIIVSGATNSSIDPYRDEQWRIIREMGKFNTKYQTNFFTEGR